ncbi:twin-arginine translocase subunit TatC [Halopiger thermotolerans]
MSSAVDEDTARAINSGRETLGALLSSAQTHLQKVFIVFVIGFIGSFYALRAFVWDFLKATAKQGMSEEVSQAADIITRTPFEVILLQAKIGMVVGIIFAIPALLYFSRDALHERGVRSVVPVSKWYAAGLAMVSAVLFCVGAGYAYGVFFPFAFDFLATISYEAGVSPHWGITEFTEFTVLLTLSFGLAAQLPLLMSALAYTEIVSYETFRDKWRHAAVAIVVFGALFSPPDPFTQIMWALPLFVLYVFSLGLSKVVTNIRRRGATELDTGVALMKRRVLQFVGALAVVAVGATVFINQDGLDRTEEALLPLLPSGFRPNGLTLGGLESLSAEYGLLGDAAVGLVVAAGVGLVVLVGYTIRVLQSPVYPREDDIRTADDPDDVDFEALSAEDVADVPAQVFLSMDEEEALEYSRQAMYDDNRDKAEAILNRFDSLQEQAAESDSGTTADADGVAANRPDAAGGEDEDESFVASTAAGMLDPFTEDETTEDDIGGYAYDLAFIIDSLTSKTIYIVGVFMAVLGGTFIALYQGGFSLILAQFIDQVPDEALAAVADGNEAYLSGDMTTEATIQLLQDLGLVVALEPVEVLIFMVKVSTILGFLAVLPLICYWSWPAAKERGLVTGDSRTFLVWGLALFVGFGLGVVVGFYWIAPAVISYLITDALANGMEVSYRINSFSWLVIYTTLGVGFLFNIVVTMALFHVGGIVSYRTMLERWRPAVVGIFTVAAFASPKGILTMLLLAIPIALTYLLGLAVLYVLTAGGRLFGGGRGGAPAEPEADADGAVAE